MLHQLAAWLLNKMHPVGARESQYTIQLTKVPVVTFLLKHIKKLHFYY
jgi:hypothetical protein